MGFMRKHVLLLQRQQQQRSSSWAQLQQLGFLLLLLLFTASAAAAASDEGSSTNWSASKPMPTAPPVASGKAAAATTAAAAAATAAAAAAAAPKAAAAPRAAATTTAAAPTAAAAAAGPCAKVTSESEAKAEPASASPPLHEEANNQSSAPAAAGSAASEAAAGVGASGGTAAERGDEGGVFGVQGEGQEEAGEQGERQLVGEGGSSTLLAKNRPVFAPFVRHYSKYMAILWEWYTKTIGATMNGKRRQDEDALVVHAPAMWQPNVRFKAVFDGHGGPSVSRTCVAQFCNFYGNMPDLKPETFTNASLLLDALIREDMTRHKRGGSTGLVVAVERPHEHVPKFRIHVSNIGDSRAFILHQNGTYTIMTKDHKPNDPVEAARIANAGGFVSRVRKIFRVDGTLSVSRAFGDVRMKLNPLLSPTEQKVIAVPDVRTFDARGGDYIFMACDGMFEAPGMSWDFVANLLHRELQNTQDNLVETAFRMLNTAYLLGSADNISIVLTKLMNRKRSSSTVKRFTYDYSGRREFIDSQMVKAPNDFRSGTYHTASGPVVTLF
ncbi:hypothetical protein Esti_001950 [Eimeria stiedai]